MWVMTRVETGCPGRTVRTNCFNSLTPSVLRRMKLLKQFQELLVVKHPAKAGCFKENVLERPRVLPLPAV